MVKDLVQHGKHCRGKVLLRSFPLQWYTELLKTGSLYNAIHVFDWLSGHGICIWYHRTFYSYLLFIPQDQYTALHVAVKYCKPQVVQILLGYGANVQLKGGKVMHLSSSIHSLPSPPPLSHFSHRLLCCLVVCSLECPIKVRKSTGTGEDGGLSTFYHHILRTRHNQ